MTCQCGTKDETTDQEKMEKNVMHGKNGGFAVLLATFYSLWARAFGVLIGRHRFCRNAVFKL